MHVEPTHFRHLHVKGSVNLPYTAFSQEALKRVVPNKTTRILIYCRNNLTHIPRVQPDLDLSWAKDQAAGLNIVTFITLYIYGYQDVWELDPVVNPDKSVIQFEGAQAATVRTDERSRAPEPRTMP